MSEIDATTIATLVKGGATALSVALGSKPAALFIEKISGAIGWYMEPRKIQRNARAEAAASIIKAQAVHEIKEIDERAATRIIYEESRHQQNMESIVLKTIHNIKDDAVPESISDDWLTNFFEKCRRISNEEMHNIWAQVLAGEVNKPGSFSARTINFLSTISPAEAKYIRLIKACTWGTDTKEIYLMVFNEMLMNSETVGMDYAAFLHLAEIGVIYIDEDGLLIAHKELSINQGRKNILITLGMNENITVGNAKLTGIGYELCSISDFEINAKYQESLIVQLRAAGYGIEER